MSATLAGSVPHPDSLDCSCPGATCLFDVGPPSSAPATSVSAQNAGPIRSQRCQVTIQLPARDLAAVLVPLKALCIQVAAKSVFT